LCVWWGVGWAIIVHDSDDIRLCAIVITWMEKGKTMAQVAAIDRGLSTQESACSMPLSHLNPHYAKLKEL
jgi:hypothetical protein